MEYSEDEFLSLSGIQHFEFCRRQWALIHIEQQWAENLRTVEGNIMHEKAHDGYSSDKRKDLIISRGMAISSKFLGTNGVCDIVEFERCEDGIPIFGRSGKYILWPVEYKHGKEKESDADLLQLTAQAMCLEEMLCCSIPYGYVYYGEKKRRLKVELTEELRNKVVAIFQEMHEYYKRKYTPKVKRTKSCNACSLNEICLPKLNKIRIVSDYIEKAIKEEDE